MSKIQRDLLRRFMNGNKNQQESEEEREEIELSLGLSLNGRFGVDPKKLLTRSSSIPDFVAKDNNNDESAFGLPMACANLVRTCSLPTETEADWRKRKELQTLRRMEAKRKRSEKQRNFKIARRRSRVFSEEILAEDDNKRQQPLFSWVNGARPPTAIVQKTCAVEAAASQGSSPPSGSSGVSEFDTQLSQGLNTCSEAVSPSSIQSVPKSGQKLPPHPGAATAEEKGQFVGVAMENEPNKKPNAEKGVREVVRNVLEDMPCVSTKGDGPNGKRIEGFLYRYRKGEEVRIVCVCHGSFLSPAEFVKHAGGGDVAHPLKHIVVDPSSLL